MHGDSVCPGRCCLQKRSACSNKAVAAAAHHDGVLGLAGGGGLHVGVDHWVRLNTLLLLLGQQRLQVVYTG